MHFRDAYDDLKPAFYISLFKSSCLNREFFKIYITSFYRIRYNFTGRFSLQKAPTLLYTSSGL